MAESTFKHDSKIHQRQLCAVGRRSSFILKDNRALQRNTTGLPDNLKAGIENLSGLSVDGVKVHYNSDKPAQINALAYAQGQDIHLGPGQERHLPHEGWHAVQQMQGRVKPTMQAKGVKINDDKGLEREADAMGAKAATHRVPESIETDPVDSVQTKMPLSAAQRKPGHKISGPTSVGSGSYRIGAEVEGRSAGSVKVRPKGESAIELTDLGVNPSQRGQDVGGALMASALKTGQQLGKTKVSLAAQDNGSGHLTRWYKNMGFSHVGVNHLGFPQLEAPIGRIRPGQGTPTQTLQEKYPSGGVTRNQQTSHSIGCSLTNLLTIQRMEGNPNHPTPTEAVAPQLAKGERVYLTLPGRIEMLASVLDKPSKHRYKVEVLGTGKILNVSERSLTKDINQLRRKVIELIRRKLGFASSESFTLGGSFAALLHVIQSGVKGRTPNDIDVITNRDNYLRLKSKYKDQGKLSRDNVASKKPFETTERLFGIKIEIHPDNDHYSDLQEDEKRLGIVSKRTLIRKYFQRLSPIFTIYIVEASKQEEPDKILEALKRGNNELKKKWSEINTDSKKLWKKTVKDIVSLVLAIKAEEKKE